MNIQTAHFGEVEIDERRILDFESGIPGLEACKRFVLLSSEESRPVSWLQSLEDPNIALPVVDPFKLDPAYSFDISQDDINTLDIRDVKDVFVLNILVIPRNNKSIITVNLAAPIIINVRNNTGCQIILDDRKYRVRVPVAELLDKRTKGGV